ncbi:GntR family transcriptional regulator [Allorhizobium taibaishanense]|uniref:GntR family transcriptional regulator n=1 Tax=Allorhizobium taibaishanense TaxID=887144 RepID=A0A1Q9A9U8_9HYPH|nr:GntR family transcriptional regulator [Allorhizobium taibaishanense]MBB4009989.1 DNA-binding GntR family transcriptional regulator [Allorhizobium taibaishanense]OLP51604.1 GntR family transcriptional regulator [Allorhizobium taibaishanense]
MTETATIKVERPSKTLRELALEKVRDAIISGHFRPGDRLVERDLCAQLGVSRTVVREVLRHLESEGLVNNPLGKGPMVALLDVSEARQIYEIRGALEGMAARLAAEAAHPAMIANLAEALAGIRACYAQNDMPGVLTETTRFYEALFTGIERRIAWDVVKQMTVRINHLRSMTIKTTARSVEGPAQMEKIVEAIKAGDGQAAEQAAMEHVRRASAIAEAVLAQQARATDNP